MEIINENDQIRKSLEKIRLIITENEMINLRQDKNEVDNEETTKSGDEIMFDDINTVGFLNSRENMSDELKNSLTMAIGELIKATGLIMDTIAISVEGSRVIMKSETLKNPNTDSIKSIIFDTNEDNPKIEVIGGTIEISDDFTTMLQNVNSVFSDNQIGRNKLISLTQGNV